MTLNITNFYVFKKGLFGDIRRTVTNRFGFPSKAAISNISVSKGACSRTGGTLRRGRRDFVGPLSVSISMGKIVDGIARGSFGCACSVRSMLGRVGGRTASPSIRASATGGDCAMATAMATRDISRTTGGITGGGCGRTRGTEISGFRPCRGGHFRCARTSRKRGMGRASLTGRFGNIFTDNTDRCEVVTSIRGASTGVSISSLGGGVILLSACRAISAGARGKARGVHISLGTYGNSIVRPNTA